MPAKALYLTADAYTGLGVTYSKIGKINKANTYFYKAIAINEKCNNQPQLAKDYLNLALNFKINKDFKKSFAFNTKAKKIFLKLKDSLQIAIIDNNLSQFYNDFKKYHQGIQSATLAKKYFEENGLKRYTAFPLFNIGVSYDSLGQLEKAQRFYLQSISIHKDNNEFYEMANVYHALANLYYKKKQYAAGITMAHLAFDYASKVNSLEFKTFSSKILGKYYIKQDNYKQAIHYMDLHLAYKDSLYEIAKEKAIEELYIKYETEKKEKLLAEAKSNLLVKESKIRQRNNYLIIIIGLTFLLGFLGLMVNKQQQLQNKQIVKENKLKQALIEIEHQNNLQEQRLAISKDLHDNIGAQLTFIISSLDNLKFFEFSKEKLYAKFDAIGDFTRNTITGLRDTIWAMNKEAITFEDLKIRTANFIEAARTSLSDISFEFNYTKDSQDIELNSLQGIDIYRIIQEAVHNAIKHAKATKIVVDFEVIKSTIEISIIDNGIGFDKVTTEKGNGMLTMQKRANEIHADFSIEQMQSGTKVTLKFNLH